MKKLLIILTAAISLVAMGSQSPEKLPQHPQAQSELSETHTISHIEATSLLTSVESKVREAAVKVYTPGGGHGSGGLININRTSCYRWSSWPNVFC